MGSVSLAALGQDYLMGPVSKRAIPDAWYRTISAQDVFLVTISIVNIAICVCLCVDPTVSISKQENASNAHSDILSLMEDASPLEPAISQVLPLNAHKIIFIRMANAL